MRCFGRNRDFARCRNTAHFLFCYKHRIQFLLLLLIMLPAAFADYTNILNFFHKKESEKPNALISDSLQKQDDFSKIENMPVFNEYKIGFDSSRSIILNSDIVDEELTAIWENARLNSKHSLNEANVIQRADNFIVISSKAISKVSDEIDWKIKGKRLALEKIARYSLSIFSDEDSAKYFFMSGKPINLKYDPEQKEVELLFQLPIKEE